MAEPAPHPDHDATLVAALAAGDLTDPAAQAEADRLITDCPDCSTLHADLLAIASATRALPAPARPRSFTLTSDQAARLGPSPWRRLKTALASPSGLVRPLAATFTTLGIAGLLLTALPAAGPVALLGGSAASAQQERQVTGQEDAAVVTPSGLPSAAADRNYAAAAARASVAAAEPSASTQAPTAGLTQTTEMAAPSVLTLVSLVLLAVGVGLLALVIVAGRGGRGDPARDEHTDGT